MTGRDRVNKALNHIEPDRVPLDLGSTSFTGIHPYVYEDLKAYLGIDTQGETVIKKSGVTLPSEELLVTLGIDTRGLFLGNPDAWQPTDGEVIKFSNGMFTDEWGIVRTKTKSSPVYSISKSPLAGNITVKDVENYSWPNPEDPGRYRWLLEKAKYLHEETDYAVVFHFSGDMMLLSQYMRGFEEWFMDISLNPSIIEAILDRILDFWLKVAEISFPIVRDYVDVVTLVDDVSTKDGLMISPEMYHKYIKPRQRKLFDIIKAKLNAKILYHCCGAVFDLCPDFIDLGVDALNPVQVSAKGMDTARLKQEYGQHLSFWGGIDTTTVLSRGNTENVRREVSQRIDDLAAGGGYVIAAVHNILPGVSPQNIATMFETGKKYGVY